MYIASFPKKLANQHQVSRDGGVQPLWRRDQKELYFLTLDGKMMAATVHPGIEAGTPRTLFQTHVAVNPTNDQYAVLNDGRFLVAEPVTPEGPGIQVVMNWPALLKQR